MARERGLRERKKAQTRERIADVAAALFAEHGYEAVSVVEVARAADLSDQTVYNYFPAKQDLVLDRTEQFIELYRSAVEDRPEGQSPADALRPLVAADIDRYRHADPRLARGEFPAQCVASPVLRRFALEFREQQTETVAAAITQTATAIEPLVAHAHAAALIAVVQALTDRIGRDLLAGPPTEERVAELHRAATTALDDLDRAYRTTTATATASSQGVIS